MTADINNRYGHALDTQGLTRLKADLKNPTPETARAVARQFESLFVNEMLKSMRAASPGDGLFGGQAEGQYRDLLDQQLSMQMSGGRGLGLAPVIERQLLAGMGLPPDVPALDKSVAAYRRSAVSRPAAAAGPAMPAAPALGSKASAWKSPEDFVNSVWRAAERTAEKLGVSAKALVAQAALETGWGRHVIQKGDGASSFNLFGIKSHRDWDGEAVKVPTLEFRDGVARKELASFRAYGSLEESFEDYARFLQSHPRYQRALQAEDPEAFVRELQEAGYATDPEYADKITRIMQSPLLGEGVLKNPDSQSTT